MKAFDHKSLVDTRYAQLRKRGYLTLKEASLYSGLSILTMRRWAKEGRIRSKRWQGRIFVLESEVCRQLSFK